MLSVKELKLQLVNLYQSLYELTLTDCKATCKLGIGSCCSPEYCDMALIFAKEQWNIDLQPTNNKNLLFLGQDGCVVAPHLRPCCTVHHCKINAIGFKPGDPKWTRKYFKLRNKIEQLEWQKQSHTV